MHTMPCGRPDAPTCGTVTSTGEGWPAPLPRPAAARPRPRPPVGRRRSHSLTAPSVAPAVASECEASCRKTTLLTLWAGLLAEARGLGGNSSHLQRNKKVKSPPLSSTRAPPPCMRARPATRVAPLRLRPSGARAAVRCLAAHDGHHVYGRWPLLPPTSLQVTALALRPTLADQPVRAWRGGGGGGRGGEAAVAREVLGCWASRAIFAGHLHLGRHRSRVVAGAGARACHRCGALRLLRARPRR